ncbi:carboxylesterase family protein [Candidatus Nitrospira bockiana]
MALRTVIAAVLAGAVFLAPFAWQPAAGQSFSSPSLAELVREYLVAADGDEADRLLTDILARSDASIAGLETILREGPQYRSQAIGLQPGRPVSVRGRPFSYGLYVPPGYDSTKAYPLVLCLHGAGFTGDAYLERWQARLADQYLLACPTLLQGNWWTRDAADLVLATLRDVAVRYHVDPDRVFLTGMSNGGIGVYLVGTHYAPLFAGLAPMAAGLDEVLMPFLENLRHTPVYLIHGVKDQVMPVSLSRRIAEELTRLGYPFVYREHDRTHPIAGGHYFPREELPDLVAWFAARRRDPLPKQLTLVRDASHLLPFSWVRIDATDRIAAFTDRLIDSDDDAIVTRRYARLQATVAAPNRIEVQTDRVRRFTLFLNDALVDLSQPVTVVTNGRVSYQALVRPSAERLLRDARQRRDPRALFPSAISIDVGSP